MDVETLSRGELLMLLSILEGELEAQDIVIHNLRREGEGNVNDRAGYTEIRAGLVRVLTPKHIPLPVLRLPAYQSRGHAGILATPTNTLRNEDPSIAVGNKAGLLHLSLG
ncbi:CTTNBP2 N-terminal-like protein [Tachysurus ichikawai]